jgi:uncharacterized protein with PQ loop repeat
MMREGLKFTKSGVGSYRPTSRGAKYFIFAIYGILVAFFVISRIYFPDYDIVNVLIIVVFITCVLTFYNLVARNNQD